MSWDADRKATRRAAAPSAQGADFGFPNAIAVIPSSRDTWVRNIHPRRLPIQGGTKRSIRGDQRNFPV
jgi:hypothetical protein